MTTTTLPAIELPDYDAEKREANEARVRSSHVGSCIVCGRPLNRSQADNGYWVHMSTGWQVIGPDDTEADSQGCFPIGSECAKQIPAAYRIKQTAAPKVVKPKPRKVSEHISGATGTKVTVWEVTMPDGAVHIVTQRGRIFCFLSTQFAYTMSEAVAALLAN